MSRKLSLQAVPEVRRETSGISKNKVLKQPLAYPHRSDTTVAGVHLPGRSIQRHSLLAYDKAGPSGHFHAKLVDRFRPFVEMADKAGVLLAMLDLEGQQVVWLNKDGKPAGRSSTPFRHMLWRLSPYFQGPSKNHIEVASLH